MMTLPGDDPGAPWFKRLFGSTVVCWKKGCEDTPVPCDVPVEEVILGGRRTPPEVVALYFPPAPPVVDDFSPKLRQLYERFGCEVEAECGKGPRLVIVQVVWASNQEPVPWCALTQNDLDRQRWLCGRFMVRGDSPELVLLRGATGRVLTRAGRAALLRDPSAEGFPWPPRPVRAALSGPLLRSVGPDAESVGDAAHLLGRPGQVLGLYFSAHWCPPCRAFTPQLVETYNVIRKREESFEIVFVSSDRSESSFLAYARTMPWPAIPLRDAARRSELASLLGVQAIPALVLLDHRGRVITDDGRGEVLDDPEGLRFPWRPGPVRMLSERLAARLHLHPAIILFIEGAPGEVEWARGILKEAAEACRRIPPADPTEPSSLCADEGPESDGEADDDSDPADFKPRLQFYVAVDGEVSDHIRAALLLEDAVPLLAAVDASRGVVCVLEDDEDDDDDVNNGGNAGNPVNAAAAAAFAADFVRGQLRAAPVGLLMCAGPLAPVPLLASGIGGGVVPQMRILCDVPPSPAEETPAHS